jgi:hypothetical protein
VVYGGLSLSFHSKEPVELLAEAPFEWVTGRALLGRVPAGYSVRGIKRSSV